jgi:hypothetical protein
MPLHILQPAPLVKLEVRDETLEVADELKDNGLSEALGPDDTFAHGI